MVVLPLLKFIFITLNVDVFFNIYSHSYYLLIHFYYYYHSSYFYYLLTLKSYKKRLNVSCTSWDIMILGKSLQNRLSFLFVCQLSILIDKNVYFYFYPWGGGNYRVGG